MSVEIGEDRPDEDEETTTEEMPVGFAAIETLDNGLSDEANARVAALFAARQLLSQETQFMGGIGTGTSLPKWFRGPDLIEVAEWIIGPSVRPITVVTVPADQVEAVSDLNPAEDFRPGGLLIVPESPASAERRRHIEEGG